MSALRRHAASALLLLLAASAAAAGEIRAPSGDLVRYEDGLEDLAEEVVRRLPEARARVAERLGIPDDARPAEIALVRGHEALREAVGAAVPDWAVGVAVGAAHRIGIRSDLLARGFGGGVGSVLVHEWVHLAWSRRVAGRTRPIPLWLEEGIAEEVGGGMSLDMGVALDRAVAADSFHAFDDIARSFPSDAREADLAYKQSRSWVRHFVSRRGWEDLRAILARAAGSPAGEDLATVVREVSGRGLEEWHSDWRRVVEEEARTPIETLFQELDLLVLVLAALVAFVGFFTVRRSRRRDLEALPDDAPAPGEQPDAGAGEENRGGPRA